MGKKRRRNHTNKVISHYKVLKSGGVVVVGPSKCFCYRIHMFFCFCFWKFCRGEKGIGTHRANWRIKRTAQKKLAAGLARKWHDTTWQDQTLGPETGRDTPRSFFQGPQSQGGQKGIMKNILVVMMGPNSFLLKKGANKDFWGPCLGALLRAMKGALQEFSEAILSPWAAITESSSWLLGVFFTPLWNLQHILGPW